MPATPGTAATSTIAQSIQDGDLAARDGNWPLAVQIWVTHLDDADGFAANTRLRWFLDEAGPEPHTAAPPSTRRRALRLITAGVLCGIAGTVMVLIGESQTGTTRNILATLAWVLYIATAALAVFYAYRIGHPNDAPPPRITSYEVQEAQQRAAVLTTPATRTKPKHRRAHRGMRR